jgi:hypothetical protein
MAPAIISGMRATNKQVMRRGHPMIRTSRIFNDER